MKKKLFLLLCLNVVMVFCVSISFASGKPFIDVPISHWAYEAIQYWNQYNKITGYADGSFRPDAVITRAEFAKLVNEMVETDKKVDVSDVEFMDVSKLHWAYEDIKVASVYMKDHLKNRFRPDVPLTREEAAIAMVTLLGMEDNKYDISTLKKFSDTDFLLSGDSEKYVAIAIENGIMNGYPNGTFAPKGSVTRAQVMEMFYNIFVKVPKMLMERMYSGDNNPFSFENAVKRYENMTIEDWMPKVELAEEVTGNASVGTSKVSASYTEPDGRVYYYSVIIVPGSDGKGEIEWYTYFSSGDERWERFNYNGNIRKIPVTDSNFDYEKRHEELSVFKTRPEYSDIFSDKATTTNTPKSSNTKVALEVSLNGQKLEEGKTYSITNEEEIDAVIHNAFSGSNFIYYMFAYGNNYQNTIVKKVASSNAKIPIPEEVTGKQMRLSIWGTSIKNGRSEVTGTYIYHFGYTNKRVEPSKCQMTVRQNGILVNANEVIDAGRGDQIKIAGTIPEEVKAIQYRFDDASSYEVEESSSTTIEVPQKFVLGSQHSLSIVLIDKYDKIMEQQNYVLKITSKSIRASLDFMVTYGGKVYTENAEFENARAEQKIIVRGKPVNNIQSIEYKWNIEKEYTTLPGATGTITIPKTLASGTTYQLMIRVVDKAGNVSEQRVYTVVMK